MTAFENCFKKTSEQIEQNKQMDLINKHIIWINFCFDWIAHEFISFGITDEFRNWNWLAEKTSQVRRVHWQNHPMCRHNFIFGHNQINIKLLIFTVYLNDFFIEIITSITIFHLNHIHFDDLHAILDIQSGIHFLPTELNADAFNSNEQHTINDVLHSRLSVHLWNRLFRIRSFV